MRAGEDEELDEYREKISKAHLSEEVERKLLKDVDKLAKQPFGSAEASVLRNYLDTCMEMPWGEETKERASVDAARKILDRDHYGLQKVKERILEFIAVRQLNPEAKGQILCLVGPPGVGKTSIALSVAKAMNRKVARLSLGGVRDEADIRGHRKTYIGAMPGRIIEAISRSGSMNPLLVLDEVDKMGSDGRGDPASALLEVLDSEQNYAFRDHYLEIPVDLSRVMFIMTANTLDTIPRPLLDRMEIIEIPSYTDEEKVQIAQRHLLPKERQAHGLTASSLRVDESAIRAAIALYTRESGVRFARASARQNLPQGGNAACYKRCKASHRDREEHQGLPRYAACCTGEDPRKGPCRRGERPCVDRGGRRNSARRGRRDGWQRQGRAHGQPGRRDAGELPRGTLVPAPAGAGARHRAGLLQDEGHPYPLP